MEGSDREACIRRLRRRSNIAQEIRSIQVEARSTKAGTAAMANDHPAHSKGWTAPAEIDHHKVEGSWRAHQVPMTDVAA